MPCGPLVKRTIIILWPNTHLMTLTFSTSDPRWSNGSHFSSQNCMNWPNLKDYAVWLFGQADQNYTLDEYTSYDIHLFQIRTTVAEWRPI